MSHLLRTLSLIFDLPGKQPLARKVPLEWHRPSLKTAPGMWHRPSLKTAPGMEGPPEKRRTFRENSLWHGRSPRNGTDLPGKWLLAWKVPLQWHRPSGKTASGMEGPPGMAPTFRENMAPTFLKNGPWHGRSPGKTQDLPGKQPLAWKVPRKKRRPSGKTASGMEGPPAMALTFRKNSLWPGRFCGRRGRIHC